MNYRTKSRLEGIFCNLPMAQQTFFRARNLAPEKAAKSGGLGDEKYYQYCTVLEHNFHVHSKQAIEYLDAIKNIR